MKKTKMTALRVLVAMSFFASSQVLGQVAESSSFFDVVKYGAVGDGKTLCTKAIEIDPQRFAVAYAERAFIYYVKKNMTKRGRMSTRQRVWGRKFGHNFSRLFKKTQEEKSELG